MKHNIKIFITVLISIFVSNIAITRVKAIGEYGVEFHDSFFEYRAEYLQNSYRLAYLNAIEFANDQNLKDYVIFPQSKTSVILANLDTCNLKEKCEIQFMFRWVKQSKYKEFYWTKDQESRLKFDTYIFTDSSTEKSDSYFAYITASDLMPSTLDNSVFKTQTNLHYPVKTHGNAKIKFSYFPNQAPYYYFNEFFYKNKTYKVNDLILNETNPTIEVWGDVQGRKLEIVNARFSVVDYSKYKYQYALNDSQIWIDIKEDHIVSDLFQYHASGNTRIDFRIVDKITNDVITLETYYVVLLDDPLPYIEINRKNDDKCIVDNKTYCVTLQVDNHILNSFNNRYSFYVSFDNQMWQKENERYNEYNLTENTTIHFKIVDNTDNTIIDYETYTIDQISDIQGHYVRFIERYNSITQIAEVDMYFYNVDTSKYKYYYGTDTRYMTEISSEFNYHNEKMRKITKSFTNNSIIYIKITDQSDNFITSFSYEINHNQSKTVKDYMNDVINFINSIADYIKHFVDIIFYFFNAQDEMTKNAIITLFTILVVCAIVKVIRK